MVSTSGAFEEDALRAVAVMHVDIEDRDALVLAAQALRGDRGVVQEAEAAGHVGIGVMAGRPAERVGVARALQHEVGSGRRHFGAASAASQVPGPIGQARSTWCQPARPASAFG